MLADKAVELGYVESIARETVRQSLKKTNSSPGRTRRGAFRELSGEFVARMEDVLDLYEEEYDTERPVVCFDETSKQLIARTHENAD